MIHLPILIIGQASQAATFDALHRLADRYPNFVAITCTEAPPPSSFAVWYAGKRASGMRRTIKLADALGLARSAVSFGVSAVVRDAVVRSGVSVWEPMVREGMAA